MKIVTLMGAWYVDTKQYARLGYDESLKVKYVINADHIDYIEKNECDGEPIHYIIKLSDGSCIVTIDTDFLKDLK